MISAYVRGESKTVHITGQGYINLSKFYKSLKELTMKLNREPSLEEISAYAKISLEEIKKTN